MKESLIKQRPRVKWILEGDRNTNFFHAIIESRRRQNQILVLNKEGILLEDVTDIKMEVRRFYEESYLKSNLIRPTFGGLEFKICYQKGKSANEEDLKACVMLLISYRNSTRLEFFLRPS